MDDKNWFEEHSANKTQHNTRSCARVPVPLISVNVGEGPKPLHCIMMNLGCAGALVQAPKLMGEQSVIKTRFMLPDTKTPVDCNSKVVWSQSVYNVHSRIGIHFEDIDADTAEKINGYVLDQIMPRPEKNRRAERRAPASYLSVRVDEGHGASEGIILDISRSGVLVQSATKPTPRFIVKVEFTLPGTTRAIKCLARVAWRKTLYGALVNEGLNFIDIDAEGLKSIDEFLGRQELHQA